jgi:hypothetical protein
MTRRRHTPDQIIRKLAEGNKLLAGGTELAHGTPRLTTSTLVHDPEMFRRRFWVCLLLTIPVVATSEIKFAM